MRLIKYKGSRLRSQRGGFSLVEAIFAMTVVGLMVAALLGGVAWCVASVRIARENSRATEVMLEKMEVIRLLTWDQITTGNIIPAKFTAPYVSSPTKQGSTIGWTYYGKFTVLPPLAAQLSADYGANIRVVSVQVNWTNSGVPHSRSLTSYVSRYGIQNYAIN